MNRKVLCVDDDESILKGMHLHLSRKFDLSVATSGDKGSKLFEAGGSVCRRGWRYANAGHGRFTWILGPNILRFRDGDK